MSFHHFSNKEKEVQAYSSREKFSRGRGGGQPGILTCRLVEERRQGRRGGYHGNRLLACTSSESRVACRSFIPHLRHPLLLCPPSASPTPLISSLFFAPLTPLMSISDLCASYGTDVNIYPLPLPSLCPSLLPLMSTSGL